jgi:hypothetical protein
VSDEARRLRFTGLTIALLVALNVVGAWTRAGWPLATFNTALILLLDVLYVWRFRDGVLGRWLLLGLAAGVVELTADWWLVARTRTLVYPAGQPMILASPAYMPFAWAMVLAQIGPIGAALGRRLPLPVATLLTALLSGVNIPLYEHLAHDANYWYYRDTPQLFNAPYNVIAAEFLLALPLVWLGREAERLRWPWSAALGVVEGVWMLPSVLLAFWLLGPCADAVIQLPCR